MRTTQSKSKTKSKNKHKDVEWVGKGVKEGRYTYYSSALLDGELPINIDDTVLISPDKDSIPLYIAKVGYMYDGPGGAMVHVQWFGRSIDTILGESGDPAEIFLLTECEDQPLLSIWKHCQVTHMPEAEFDNWRKEGGQEPWQLDSVHKLIVIRLENILSLGTMLPHPSIPQQMLEGHVPVAVLEVSLKNIPMILRLHL